MEQEDKKCLECGEELIGRTDKKFCNDGCRNAYNNKQYSKQNGVVKHINSILQKNRKILGTLLIDEVVKVPKKKLDELGFNFNYYTHHHTTSKGTNYIYCYEYGYLPLENNFFLIVKKKEGKQKT